MREQLNTLRQKKKLDDDSYRNQRRETLLQRERQRSLDREIKSELEKYGMRVEVDDRSEKIGYKIREAQLQKINYMFVVGDKEVEEKTVSVRKRGEGDIGSMALSDIIARLNEEIATKAIN